MPLNLRLKCNCLIAFSFLRGRSEFVKQIITVMISSKMVSYDIKCGVIFMSANYVREPRNGINITYIIDNVIK